MEESRDGWRRYPAEKNEYDRIRDGILDAADTAEMSHRQQIRLELGIEEILINIISYAYEGEGSIWVKTNVDGSLFRLEFVDHGKAFDPLARDMRPNDGVPTIDQEEGGYGIYLVKKNFSSVVYAREQLFGNMANHLTMELPLS